MKQKGRESDDQVLPSQAEQPRSRKLEGLAQQRQILGREASGYSICFSTTLATKEKLYSDPPINFALCGTSFPEVVVLHRCVQPPRFKYDQDCQAPRARSTSSFTVIYRILSEVFIIDAST